jgi:hypothetical protein
MCTYARLYRAYDATQAYAVSKLANVLHTKELAVRLREMGADITVNCVHPGIVRTRLNRDREGIVTDLVFVLLSKLLKTIPQVLINPPYLTLIIIHSGPSSPCVLFPAMSLSFSAPPCLRRRGRLCYISAVNTR